MTNSTHPPIVAVIGRSGVGKTTVLEGLIAELKRRGYLVGTIKHHAHPGFDIDHPGKDTYRHAQAGSDHVVISAPDKIAAIRRVDEEVALHEIAATMTDVDIILTDGYRSSPVPKIEIVRAARSSEPLCDPAELSAMVTDLDLTVGVPSFAFDDLDGLASFIVELFLPVE